MRIQWEDGFKDINVTDDSYRYRRIMGENALTVNFSLASLFEFPIGSYVIFESERYNLNSPAIVTKVNTKQYDYTLILENYQAQLRNIKIKDYENRVKFSFTGKPLDFLNLIVHNLNLNDSNWQVGNYVDSAEKTLTFSHTFVEDALFQIAEEFKTEFEFVGKTINLGKLEYNKATPLALSYGKGNGFRSGVKRENNNERTGFNVLYVQGGDRNIDYSRYGNKFLLLPKNQQYVYNSDTYVTSADGLSIRKVGLDTSNRKENSLDLTNIYPKRIGAVSGIISNNGNYDFTDTSIPSDLDYTFYQIAGETLRVRFESGILTGKEFDVNYIHAERKFELISKEIDGQTMPNATFKPDINDKYGVFGMMLPDEYISNNVTKTGASWEMFKEAVKYFSDNQKGKFVFNGDLDPIWAKKNWLSIQPKIKLGSYVQFSDLDTNTIVRIVGIKDYINNPHAPEIELSNTVQGGGVYSEIQKIGQQEVVIAQAQKRNEYNAELAKRSWNFAEEIKNNVFDNEGYFNPEKIKPLSIETSMITVGSKMQQFLLPDVLLTVLYDNTAVKNTAGKLVHLTIGETPREWTIAENIQFSITDEFNYIYVKAEKEGTNASILVSTDKILVDEDTNYYHFLAGYLGSIENDFRRIKLVHGFTQIAPGEITTGRISSADGSQYIDLLQDSIDINANVTLHSSSTAFTQIAQQQDPKIEQAKVDANNYTNTQINSLQTELGDVNTALDDLSSQLNNSIPDGEINQDGLIAIENAKNQMITEYNDINPIYTEIFGNEDLVGTAKTELQTAKGEFDLAHSDLLDTLNNAVADSKINEAEKTAIDQHIADYKAKKVTLHTKLENALSSIETAKIAQAEADAQAEIDALPPSSSPNLIDPNDIIRRYYDGNSTLQIADYSITAVANSVSLAGYLVPVNPNTSYNIRYNSSGYVRVFVPHYNAMPSTSISSERYKTTEDIPVDTTITTDSNTQYIAICMYPRDYDSYPQSIFNISVTEVGSGSNNQAQIDVINAQKAQEIQIAQDYTINKNSEIDAEFVELTDKISNLENIINSEILNSGDIDSYEAIAIKSNINLLKVEKADIDSKYSEIYNNSDLIGISKSNLQIAKSNFDTAHNDLISTINNATADAKITAQEKADIDAKFNTYSDNISALRIAFETALKSIESAKVQDAKDYAQAQDGILKTEAENFATSQANQAEQNANNYADLISKVTVMDATTKKFHNVAGFSTSGTENGHIVIKTPIVYNRMVTMYVEGFDYLDNQSSIDLIISFYIYSNGIYKASFRNSGTKKLNQIRIGKWSGSKAVIILSADSWNYPKITIPEVIVGHDNPPNSYKDGWSINLETSISGYTSLVTATTDNFIVRTEFDSEITTLSNQIQSKVSSTNYNQNNQVVSQQISSIDQKADNINLKVTDVENDIDSITDTGIDIANRKIKLQADNTVLVDNNGNQIAMFTVDADGNPLLRAENINTDNLVAKNLRTSESNQRVEITQDNQKIVVTDQNGEPKVQISGNSVTDESDIGATQTISDTYSYRSVSRNTTGSSTLYTNEQIVLPTGRNYKIITPAVDYSLYAKTTQSGQIIGMAAMVTVRLKDVATNKTYYVGSEQIISKPAEYGVTYPRSKSGTIPSKTFSGMDAGTYKMEVVAIVDQNVGQCTASADINSGRTLQGISMMQYMEIGRNGFNYIVAPDNYINCVNDKLIVKKGDMYAEFRDNIIGFRIDNQHIKIFNNKIEINGDVRINGMPF